MAPVEMTLTKKDKDFLQAAFEAGSRPVRSSGGNLVLKHDNKRKQLTRGRRKLEAGKHFYTLMGEELRTKACSSILLTGQITKVSGLSLPSLTPRSPANKPLRHRRLLLCAPSNAALAEVVAERLAR